MLYGLSAATRYYLYTRSTDMRKSFDGLCGLVTNQLGCNPTTGDVFIFVNRRATLIKLLVWDQTGFVIYYKRLEKGTFEVPQASKGRYSLQIPRRTLMLMLEGVSLDSIAMRKRYYR